MRDTSVNSKLVCQNTPCSALKYLTKRKAAAAKCLKSPSFTLFVIDSVTQSNVCQGNFGEEVTLRAWQLQKHHENNVFSRLNIIYVACRTASFENTILIFNQPPIRTTGTISSLFLTFRGVFTMRTAQIFLGNCVCFRQNTSFTKFKKCVFRFRWATE